MVALLLAIGAIALVVLLASLAYIGYLRLAQIPYGEMRRRRGTRG